jgi:hypothetical protein
MADARTRRTTDHGSPAAEIAALKKRVDKLEAEIASLKAVVAARPPPIPVEHLAPSRTRKHSVVDISDVAELVESVPPPLPRSGPPRPGRR